MELKYPTDRVVYFSDAVFAIAITLLVIEIKVPTHEQLETFGAGGVLIKLIPLFIGFFVTFIVTAMFWRSHLMIYHYVKHIDNALLWRNIWFLMSIALLPFSTGFYSEHANANIPFFFYCSNVIVIGLLNFRMISYIIKKERLADIIGIQAQWIKQRAIMVPAIFFICILLTYAIGWPGKLGFFLIFVLQFFGNRYYKKKSSNLPEAAAS